MSTHYDTVMLCDLPSGARIWNATCTALDIEVGNGSVVTLPSAYGLYPSIHADRDGRTVVGLPDQADGTWYIVSWAVFASLPDRHDLLNPYGCARDLRDRPVVRAFRTHATTTKKGGA